MRLAFTLAIGGFAVSLAGTSACGGAGGTGSPSERQGTTAPAVQVVQAREGVVPLRERLTGTVRASGEVAIYPDVSGPVIEVLAQNGDAVKKGDPLVRIQTPRTRSQLTQARSSLAAARAELRQAEARHRELAAEYERNASLATRGLVPLNTVDSLRAQTDASRAAVASARAQVQVAEGAVAEQTEVQAQTVVRAPITGRVGQRNVEVGMRVDTQTPLFVIGRLENMRVEVPVTQDILARIREGNPVELRVRGDAAPIAARVSRISPFLQAGSFSAEVEIDIPNETGALVPGMFVTVDIFHGESGHTTLVPTSALYDHPATGEQGVFVTGEAPGAVPAGQSGADGERPPPVRVHFRPVDLVAEAPQTIGVDGVQPGEWIVVVGQHLLASEPEPQARLHAIEWDRILELQQLQRQDLLREFMERQQRAAGES
jgi:RND family efflux transporter MFP subunit